MGRKEIHHYDYYQAAMEEEIYDYSADDEFEQEEEETQDQIKECLSLLAKDSESTLRREETLSTIIKALEDGSPYYNSHIIDNYNDFIHLFHQCLFSMEKGSSKEVYLSAYILGFLALSTAHLGYDVASTILHKSLPLIYKRLKLPFVIDSTKTVSMLSCLTIINFLVGVDSNEEEVSLNDVIWRKVTKILGEEKGSALLAYGFFLTSTNRPATIDVQTISYLCSMLDCNESKVRSISGQVLGLIFETYVLPDDVREKVLHKVNYTLAIEETKSQWNLFKKVAQFLDNGCLPEDTWTDLIRMKFFKQFLGKNGFSQHMQKNELLQAVLKVSSPATERTGSEKKDGDYISRIMGMKRVQRKKLRMVNNKRKILNKERTRSLEKGRMTKATTAGWMLL